MPLGSPRGSRDAGSVTVMMPGPRDGEPTRFVADVAPDEAPTFDAELRQCSSRPRATTVVPRFARLCCAGPAGPFCTPIR